MKKGLTDVGSFLFCGILTKIQLLIIVKMCLLCFLNLFACDIIGQRNGEN